MKSTLLLSYRDFSSGKEFLSLWDFRLLLENARKKEENLAPDSLWILESNCNIFSFFFFCARFCFYWRLRWHTTVHKMASEVGGAGKQKNKLGWERKTTRKREELAGSFSAWFRGGSWCLWTIRMDPFLQPLVREKGKKKKSKRLLLWPSWVSRNGGKSRCFDYLFFYIIVVFQQNKL